MLSNFEYLGHNFSPLTKTTCYVTYFCLKCNCKISKCEIGIPYSNVKEDKYWVCFNQLYVFHNSLNLTCDEIIIKNIIE